jgi:hypothetical protein
MSDGTRKRHRGGRPGRTTRESRLAALEWVLRDVARRDPVCFETLAQHIEAVAGHIHAPPRTTMQAERAPD